MNEQEKLLRETLGDDVVSLPERARNLEPLFPLRQIWPDVVENLKYLLTQAGEHKLAATVGDLQVFDRCRCGSEDCATVYVQPRPVGAFGEGHQNIVFWNADTVDLDTGARIGDTLEYPMTEHTTILDVVGETIMCIEILGDVNSASRLITALPEPDSAE
jgi:hypothetical protein